MTLQQFVNEIPADELKQFEKCKRLCKAGDVIITEGEPNNNTLYLLRAGTIGIYRDVCGMQEKITEAPAVAFLGEMELMESEGYRSATCSVVSEFAMIYVFKNPDLKSIIKNPVWGEILITRLCQDLHLVADHIVKKEVANAQMLKEIEAARQQSALLLSALDSLHKKVACEINMGCE